MKQENHTKRERIELKLKDSAKKMQSNRGAQNKSRSKPSEEVTPTEEKLYRYSG